MSWVQETTLDASRIVDSAYHNVFPRATDTPEATDGPPPLHARRARGMRTCRFRAEGNYTSLLTGAVPPVVVAPTGTDHEWQAGLAFVLEGLAAQLPSAPSSTMRSA